MRRAQHRIVDVAGQDLDPPGRGHQRLGEGRFEWLGSAQTVVRQRIGHQHGQGVGLLSGGAACAPDSQAVVGVLLLAPHHIVDHVVLKQVQLRLVAEEAGFIDGEVFDQAGQLLFPRLADEQAIVAVERIQLALLQPALQTVLKEGSAPVVEMHAALLVDERLQEFQFRFGECGDFACAHVDSVLTATSRPRRSFSLFLFQFLSPFQSPPCRWRPPSVFPPRARFQVRERLTPWRCRAE